MVFGRRLKASAASLPILIALGGAAHAADAAAVTRALEELLTSADAGSTITLGEPTETADGLAYSDVRFTRKEGELTQETTAKTITLAGPDVNAAGALVTEALTVEGVLTKNGDGTEASVAKIAIANLDVKEKPSTGKPPAATYDSITVDTIAMTQGGKTSATIDSIAFNAADFVGTVPRSMDLAIEGLTIDPAGFDDGGASAAQLKAFGYDKVVLSIVGKGALDEASGDLTVEELAIDAADAGEISFDGVLTGFTPDIIAKFNQPEPPPEVLTTVAIKEATLTFVDASLTKRILDFQAGQMGMTGSQLAEQLAAALPLMLTVLENPGFQDKVASAAGSFLKEPQNISLSVAPEAPVPLATLVQLGQTAPQTIPQTLNADVTANEDLAE